MVLEREDVEKPRAVKFTHAELEAVTKAAKADSNMKKTTIAKLKAMTAFARTRAAYTRQGEPNEIIVTLS